MTKEQLLEMYEKAGGILHGHFILASGRHAEQYMQSAKVFEYPEYSEAICRALAEKIRAKKIRVDCVASPAVGGIIMGYEMSRQLGVTNVFFEKNTEGGFDLRRGFSITKGQKVLVAEDVCTTGGSVIKVIDKVRELGGEVVAVASIIDRSGGEINFDLPYFNLLAMQITSYEPDECPLCKEGKTPAYKPGSGKPTK